MFEDTNLENIFAKDMIDIIKTIIKEELAKQDKLVVCTVRAMNDDGTMNVVIQPDEITEVKRVQNASKYNFKNGDSCVLQIIGGKISNSFVIAKLM